MISVVVPIFNEHENLPEVRRRLSAALDATGDEWELVFVDDGSGDGSGARGLGFRLFYPVMRRVTDLPDTPDAGIFGLMDRAVVDEFNRLPERNRFIPGLRTWLGFRQASVLYDRADRAAGEPKQTLRRLVHYAMDAIFSFSYKPLRAATYAGFIVSAVAFLLAAWYLVTFFAFKKQAGSGFTTIVLCVLFLGGVQLICVGILGEYVGRVYEEVKQRPLYVVRERVGLDAPGVGTGSNGAPVMAGREGNAGLASTREADAH